AAREPLVPPATDQGDESLGDFLARRLAAETARTIAGPILASIAAGHARALSLQATFPQLSPPARVHRSLVEGLRPPRARAGTGAQDRRAYPGLHRRLPRRGLEPPAHLSPVGAAGAAARQHGVRPAPAAGPGRNVRPGRSFPLPFRHLVEGLGRHAGGRRPVP